MIWRRDPNLIPGWFQPVEADAVVRAALRVTAAGTLLEIGTWCGRSTSFFADALPNWKIHTVDPYPDHVVAVWGRELQAHPRAIAADNFASRENVMQHRTDSVVAGRAWGTVASPLVDVLFVDGEHTESRVRAELEAWLPHVTLGGVVLFHDAVGKPDFSSAIQRAARETLRHEWVRVPDLEAGSLWAFARSEYVAKGETTLRWDGNVYEWEAR